MLRNTDAGYGLVSKLLHWLIAFGVIGLIWLGWWMVGLSYYSMWYHRAPELHKAIGIVVLAAAVLKIVWHRVSSPPALQGELKSWEKAAARAAHFVLLSSAVAIPITGYIVTTSAGEGVSFFGLFEVPALIAKNEPLRELAIDVHYYLSYALIAVIAAHAGAALKHQIMDGHGTLRRMIDR